MVLIFLNNNSKQSDDKIFADGQQARPDEVGKILQPDDSEGADYT